MLGEVTQWSELPRIVYDIQLSDKKERGTFRVTLLNALFKPLDEEIRSYDDRFEITRNQKDGEGDILRIHLIAVYIGNPKPLLLTKTESCTTLNFKVALVKCESCT